MASGQIPQDAVNLATMTSAGPDSTGRSSEHGKDNHHNIPSDNAKATHDEHEVSSDSDSDDGRAYVAKYKKNAQVSMFDSSLLRKSESFTDQFLTKYPLEVGDVVWIVSSQYRSPYGPFSISKAHSDDKFELKKRSDNSVHPVLVEGKHLKRDK